MKGGNKRTNNTEIIYEPDHWSLSNHELTILFKIVITYHYSSRNLISQLIKIFPLKFLLNVRSRVLQKMRT